MPKPPAVLTLLEPQDAAMVIPTEPIRSGLREITMATRGAPILSGQLEVATAALTELIHLELREITRVTRGALILSGQPEVVMGVPVELIRSGR
jgi:hypothetical protein